MVALLESAMDNVGAYIFTKDLNGRYTYVNSMVLELFDKPLEEVIGFDDSEFFDLKISNQIQENDRKVLKTEQAIETEESNYVKASGELRVFRSHKKPLYNDDGDLVGLCGISSDITHESKLRKTVDDQRTMLDAVLNNIDAYVYVKTSDRRFLFVNQQVADFLGKPIEQIIGRKDSELLPENIADHLWASDKRVFETNEKQKLEEVVYRSDGSIMNLISLKVPYTYCGEDDLPAFIGFSTDVTELYTLKEKFKQQARTDALTGLYNRRYFIEQAKKEFNRATRHNEELSLISIDIDHFKRVNDEFGHPAGDAVLRTIADNLQNMIRLEDTLARMGGEEFSILLPQTSNEQAICIAERIRQYHSDFPCSGLSGCLHKVTLSIGVTSMRKSDKHFDVMFSRADKALYRAKQAGRNKVLSSS